MARCTCKCGNIMSTTACPNDVQLRVYTDREWDDIINMGVIDTLDIPLPKKDVWRCSKCGRIYVFDGGYNPAIAVYKLEEEGEKDRGGK